MNRQGKRKALKVAKKLGFDPAKPDLGVVTAHYTSDHIQVITEQSSYVINLKERTALRIEGDEAAHLSHNSQWYPYDEIYSCSVGFPLRMTWHDGDRLLMRTTTLITQVNELTQEEVEQICGAGN